MSPDMYDALGLVRTQELLRCRPLLRLDQYWAAPSITGFPRPAKKRSKSGATTHPS